MSNLSERLHRAPFIRLLIPFIIGILSSEFLNLPGRIEYVLFSLIPVFILLLIFSGNSFRTEYLTGSFIFLIFLLLGLAWSIHRRYQPAELPFGKYQAVLDEYPIETGKFFRSVIRIQGNIKTLTYFEKSERIRALKPGFTLNFKEKPQLIRNRGAPYELDFRKYYLRKGIGHRIYLKENGLEVKSGRIHSLRYEALILREKILARLASSGLKGEAFHVVGAITLGSRDNLDPETTRSFIRTGTIHVLAVSGGNVAIIYVFLHLVFGFLKKRGTLFIYTLLILTGIWIYTFLTGLSPSVLRAAIMFSFIVIGKNLSRNADIYNSLASSAFVLLFLRPSLLFDAGFQLSYAAVLAIVSLQPLFYKSCLFRFWILDKIWILFTVSVAAQIGTLPFSLWYFHQFPVYFWLTNIVVVPFVSLFLYFSIVILIMVPFFPDIGLFLAKLLEWTCNGLLNFLHFAEYLPFAMIENIYLTPVQLFCGILLILLSILFFIYHRPGYLYLFLSVLNILIFSDILKDFIKFTRKEVVICNQMGRVLIGFTRAGETIWLMDEKSGEQLFFDSIIRSYDKKRGIIKAEKIVLVNPPRNGFNSYQRDYLKIRNEFINFCGLRIIFFPDQIKRMNWSVADIIVTKVSPFNFNEDNRQGSVIQLRGESISYTKASSSEVYTSDEEKALKITLGAKVGDKVSYRITYW